MLPMPFSNPATYTGHSGVDFGQPMYTPVYASGPGRIYGKAYSDACGYGIWVSYDGYPDMLYCHMPSDAWRPDAGMAVQEGTLIGYVGSTGHSTGPHLHVEVEGHATTAGFWEFFDPNRVVGDGGSSGGGSVTKWPARALYGADWVVKAQEKLIRLGYDLSPDGADGYDGDVTQAATMDLQKRGGLKPDGVFGPDTNTYADELLNPPVGTPPFPLPDGYYFGPEGGPEESVSGWHGHTRDLAKWQQRMKDRGWDITVDGLYGPEGATTPTGNTYDVALAFQKEKGLYPDGLIGPVTWKAAWEAPVTPPGGGNGGGTTPPVEGAGRNATLDDRSLIPARSTKDIQAFLKVPQTDVWDQATSDATAAFQRTWEIDEDRIWGITCDGLAFPPKNFGMLVDFSFARIPMDKLNRHQIVGVGRYLWKPKYDDGRTNKGMSREEAAGYTSSGKSIFQIYEEDGRELLGGFAAGVAAATAAEAYRKAAGLPAGAVYLNVDFDPYAKDEPADAEAKILAALDGAASVVGLARVGLYGGYRIIKAAFDAHKITWGWQTYGWSLDANGKIQWDPRAQLRQWSNGQWGDSVDFVWAMAADYGQNEITSTPDPGTPETITVNRAQLQGVVDELSSMLNG